MQHIDTQPIDKAHQEYVNTEEFQSAYKERYRIETKNSELKNRYGCTRATGRGLFSMQLQEEQQYLYPI
ncbi:hypothetical protein DWX59_26265 [Enterocloster aldenensis]|nr:hypothetical protein DWX59_26265 [Enterocloster aldenensis]